MAGTQIALCFLALPAAATAAFPPSSVHTFDDVRVQMLSPTLVRVEEKGPKGFEDAATFTVVGRDSFAGVPITAVRQLPSGATKLTTAHYEVVVKPPSKLSSPQLESGSLSWKNSTCATVRQDMDGSPLSKRIAHNPVRKGLSQPACCAACDSEAECTAWVHEGTRPSSDVCYLLAAAVAEPCRGKSLGGHAAKAPPAPPPPPPSASVTILALNGTTLASILRLTSVSQQLQFPQPAATFEASTPFWAIRDSPRFVPSAAGVVPPDVAKATGVTISPALLNTSGFDGSNDAPDIYIFLPAAAAVEDEYGYAGLRSEYLTLTGPVPPLPDEAFGTWFSWYHPYNQSGAEADIARWRADDLPIDIWGLDMDWRIWANGEEGKGYFINTELFPDMAGFYDYAHRQGLSVYMNDHPMANATQLSPAEVKFRYNGLTSLFDLGLDFWWCKISMLSSLSRFACTNVANLDKYAI